MFSPEMMQAAQQMMANMSPEQMAEMSRMAANMDPQAMQRMAQMQGQGGSMGSMPNAEQMRQAQEQMRGMSPEEMQRKMQQAQQNMAAQQNYYASAALRLKNEGNQFVGKKEFEAAKAKYREALDTLKNNNCQSDAVKQACTLNLALCHLKLEEYKECIPFCDEVLSTTANMKAFYRRGAAKLALGDVVPAYCDLSKAVEKAGGPSDNMIREEFEKCKKIVLEKNLMEECEKRMKEVEKEAEQKLKAAEKQVQDAASAAAASSPSPDAVAAPSNPSVPSRSNQQGSSSAAAAVPPMAMPGPGEMPSPDQMKQGMDMLNQNPDMLNQSMKMMEGMDEKTIAAMTGKGEEEAKQMKQAMKMMSENPDMMKQMQDMVQNMSPDEMEAMMKLQGKGAGKGGAPAAPPSFTDPETIKNMEKVVGGMTKDPKAMANMAKASGVNIPEGSGGESVLHILAKCLPWLLACWRYLMHLRQAAVWLVMSKKGRILCALLVLIFAIWQGYIG